MKLLYISGCWEGAREQRWLHSIRDTKHQVLLVQCRAPNEMKKTCITKTKHKITWTDSSMYKFLSVCHSHFCCCCYIRCSRSTAVCLNRELSPQSVIRQSNCTILFLWVTFKRKFKYSKYRMEFDAFREIDNSVVGSLFSSPCNCLCNFLARITSKLFVFPSYFVNLWRWVKESIFKMMHTCEKCSEANVSARARTKMPNRFGSKLKIGFD